MVFEIEHSFSYLLYSKKKERVLKSGDFKPHFDW